MILESFLIEISPKMNAMVDLGPKLCLLGAILGPSWLNFGKIWSHLRRFKASLNNVGAFLMLL